MPIAVWLPILATIVGGALASVVTHLLGSRRIESQAQRAAIAAQQSERRDAQDKADKLVSDAFERAEEFRAEILAGREKQVSDAVVELARQEARISLLQTENDNLRTRLREGPR